MNKPRILLYDIETAPSLVYTWEQWDANVLATKEDWYILCVAYKWLDEKTIHFIDNNGRKNDKPIVKQLHKLFDEADIVVAHNGDRFDAKKANARFMRHGFGPPSPFKQIDTLKEARRHFLHYSNKLGELGRYHTLGAKTPHTGIDLWLGCMAGDAAAWKTMRKYNIHDVELLEKLYLKLRPWIGTPGKQAHPNMGFWAEGKLVCTKCGSENVIKRGTHRTAVSEFQTLQCKECKGYSRLRKREPQTNGGLQTV